MALNKNEKSFYVLGYARTSSVATLQDYLNTNLSQCLIGHFIQDDVALMHWPPIARVLVVTQRNII